MICPVNTTYYRGRCQLLQAQGETWWLAIHHSFGLLDVSRCSRGKVGLNLTPALTHHHNPKSKDTSRNYVSSALMPTSQISQKSHLRHIWGLKRFMRKLEGISNMTYGTKKMVRATLGCIPVRPRSFGNPRVRALDMFTLEAISICG